MFIIYHFQDEGVMASQQLSVRTEPRLPLLGHRRIFRAPTWRIRMVGQPETFGTLAPPQWDTDAESKILFSSWIDNNILSVTESDGLTAEAICISWTCTL